MIKPKALSATHMECRDLKESLPVLTELLAFEKIAEGPGEATLKHPNTEWLLVVHEAGGEAPAKQMHNHWGVRVTANPEVDAAYEYLAAHKEQYGLQQIGKPHYNHGSYSVYFLEPGSNGWEIECYEAAIRKESGARRVGGVRAPHWDAPLTSERFPGRGYVPQGFTHGTLACGDIKASWNFYANVLGMEVHQANDHVVYLKCPETKCYIVSAERKEWKNFSPNFRFTVTVGSKDEVAEAHHWLRGSGKEQAVTGLGELESRGGSASFLLRDPDKNWWEVASPN